MNGGMPFTRRSALHLVPGRCSMRVACAVFVVLTLFAPATAFAEIPATPVMTIYQFNGPLAVEYYDVDRFLRDGAVSPAGTLAQGTSVIPCLVIRGGKPVMDGRGTPYVGFEVVVDARDATPASSARFTEVSKQRATMTVANHHCRAGAEHVINARLLHALDKPPSFEPPRAESAAAGANTTARSELDAIVRAFHASPQCATVNRELMRRRGALGQAWDAFMVENATRWPSGSLARARQVDYVMRTALYEGHLGRGCSAYGACERNVIVLSIRNRAIERCLSGQGCRSVGDFEGVASAVTQYNIWDEYLTQTLGLTACFLRPDLAGETHYTRLQAMYAQSVDDAERILYGSDSDLQAVFPGTPLSELTRLRHYYHPPAMGKCFPDHPRVEYITAAVAQDGEDFALIANMRIHADERRADGYLFRQTIVDEDAGRDVIRTVDRYPGFVIDGRAVLLERPSRCTPYGVSRSCRFEQIGRHRKTPSWLDSGDPLLLSCRIRARGETCREEAQRETVKVGGTCDIQMQPVAGVP